MKREESDQQHRLQQLGSIILTHLPLLSKLHTLSLDMPITDSTTLISLLSLYALQSFTLTMPIYSCHARFLSLLPLRHLHLIDSSLDSSIFSTLLTLGDENPYDVVPINVMFAKRESGEKEKREKESVEEEAKWYEGQCLSPQSSSLSSPPSPLPGHALPIDSQDLLHETEPGAIVKEEESRDDEDIQPSFHSQLLLPSDLLSLSLSPLSPLYAAHMQVVHRREEEEEGEGGCWSPGNMQAEALTPLSASSLLSPNPSSLTSTLHHHLCVPGTLASQLYSISLSGGNVREVWKWLEVCPVLREINLDYCSGLNDTSISGLAYCTRLSKISICVDEEDGEKEREEEEEEEDESEEEKDANTSAPSSTSLTTQGLLVLTHLSHLRSLRLGGRGIRIRQKTGGWRELWRGITRAWRNRQQATIHSEESKRVEEEGGDAQSSVGIHELILQDLHFTTPDWMDDIGMIASTLCQLAIIRCSYGYRCMEYMVKLKRLERLELEKCALTGFGDLKLLISNRTLHTVVCNYQQYGGGSVGSALDCVEEQLMELQALCLSMEKRRIFCMHQGRHIVGPR